MLHDRRITITVGASRKAVQWQPQTMLLSELYTRLQVPARGKETLAEYLQMPKSQQDDMKDVGGFVAGSLNGPRRKAGAVVGRDLLTLDLDNIPSGGTADVLRRVEGLGCGYCVYSTRKHMPSAPRLRVLLPLDRTCSADEYEPCVRRMAEMIGLTLADPSTFEASRLMYWPSSCADAEVIYHAADKPMLSVDGLLATYEDWRDYMINKQGCAAMTLYHIYNAKYAGTDKEYANFGEWWNGEIDNPKGSWEADKDYHIINMLHKLGWTREEMITEINSSTKERIAQLLSAGEVVMVAMTSSRPEGTTHTVAIIGSDSETDKFEVLDSCNYEMPGATPWVSWLSFEDMFTQALQDDNNADGEADPAEFIYLINYNPQ